MRNVPLAVCIFLGWTLAMGVILSIEPYPGALGGIGIAVSALAGILSVRAI